MNTMVLKHPQIRIIPPVIFATYVCLGLVLNSLFPLTFIDTSLTWLQIMAELIMLEGGIIVFMAMRGFRKSGTEVATWKPAAKLVTAGIYRFSRNPIYLGMLLLYTGLALLLGNIWLLFLSVPLYLHILYAVIYKEEDYLTQTFSEDYLRYKSEVSRWVCFKIKT